MSDYGSPGWNRTTKIIVALIGLSLIVLLAWRFQNILGQIITAVIFAYILNPLIVVLSKRTPLSRGAAILIIYVALLILILGGVTAVGVAAYYQGVNLIDQAPEFISGTVVLIQDYVSNTERIITFGNVTFSPSNVNWVAVQDQLLGLVEPTLSQSGRYATQIAQSTLRFLGNFVFVFIISAYMANELPLVRSYVNRLAYPAGYQHDAEIIMQEFGRIWSAYLRGQIILGLIIGFLVSSSLGLLGVQNALALGLIAGLLEFIPNLGPIIAAAIAMVVAFFQPENYLGLTSVQLTLAVLGLMFIIQQLENNLLVPRIVGDALDLHPVLVIIGVLIGASFAGILGAVLAAPVLATLKLIGIYAWRKLFDLPPFPLRKNEKPPPARRRRLLFRRPAGAPPAPASDQPAAAEAASEPGSDTP
ncbi:MAG: AI-2E family transporter [Ardenticatenaceae bacterium]|nr:AI-2E family transporter [Anaerolineales bacterium]MCB8917879.1 AI-2E family transporter [Ardenticatenaceae bacterium]